MRYVADWSFGKYLFFSLASFLQHTYICGIHTGGEHFILTLTIEQN